jgi:2-polyprenyl-6-methoxyphenol hydroxylase-like FAD-dependent oxidoreductase
MRPLQTGSASFAQRGDTMQIRTKKAMVIGCGIAGPVVALALRKAGWRPEIFEAKAGPSDDTGIFLNVVPNGMSVLKTLGCIGEVAPAGFHFGGIVFHDERGREIGVIDYGDEGTQNREFGASGIVIKRGRLQKGLREAAIAVGIPVHFGRKLVDIEARRDGGAAASFADGSVVEGDVVIGCDGIYSRTRRIIFPDPPNPEFTGLCGYGGFSRGAGLPVAGPMMHMNFGRSAFFDYATAADGEVYWFGNAAAREGENLTAQSAIKQRLAALHAGDPSPVREIIEATIGDIGWYPIDEMPPLGSWHSGPVVLVGDSAHAMAPHVGQGAALAMEDAIVLAKCLRECDRTDEAFARYHSARRGRVEAIGREARRSGSRKTPGPVMRVLRNLLMPFFLKIGEKKSREAYRYRVDWAEVERAA